MLGSARAAAIFCLAVGVFYGLLGVSGFVFGMHGEHTVAGILHEGAETRLLRVLPGSLELATPDHLIHVAVATLYLIAGVLGGALRTTRGEGREAR